MSRLLLLDDDRAVLNWLQVLLMQAQRFEVQALSDSTKAAEALATGGFDLVLLDMDMPVVSGMDVLRHVRQHHPGVETIVITGVGDVQLAVESMKLGAYDYLCKPVDADRLLTCVDRALERSRMREELHRLREQVGERSSRFKEAFEGFVTQDKKLLRTLARVEQIAQSDNNVLIWGESGTGKELIARAIHRVGSRADEPFVAVNAAAFAAALFESQFFGHERGAFTGADATRPGLFEEADGGTLFLDEIGEIEPAVQSKLLRVLQSGEYFRLGSTKQRGADVRIIAATNKDLDVEIEEGRFRRDLYYRLNINSIFLPPLRERRGDVELASYYFLEKYCRANGKEIHAIGDPVLELLEGYDFPGNLRELENIVAGAVVLETSDTLHVSSLPAYLRKATAVQRATVRDDLRLTLAEVEARHVRAVLEACRGNRTAAARVLGISRVGLLAKLKRLGIDVEPGGRGASASPPRVAAAGGGAAAERGR
jgi:DNA-binding NtrC family response regulator